MADSGSRTAAIHELTIFCDFFCVCGTGTHKKSPFDDKIRFAPTRFFMRQRCIEIQVYAVCAGQTKSQPRVAFWLKVPNIHSEYEWASTKILLSHKNVVNSFQFSRHMPECYTRNRKPNTFNLRCIRFGGCWCYIEK